MADQEARRIAGAVPVLVATFDDTGAVDEDSLRRQIDFCVEAGSDAIAFGMGTESHMLTDPERERMWTVAARQLDGGVPLIAAALQFPLLHPRRSRRRPRKGSLTAWCPRRTRWCCTRSRGRRRATCPT